MEKCVKFYWENMKHFTGGFGLWGWSKRTQMMLWKFWTIFDQRICGRYESRNWDQLLWTKIHKKERGAMVVWNKISMQAWKPVTVDEIFYTNIMSDTVHCLRYILYTWHLKRCLSSSLQRNCCHYTDNFLHNISKINQYYHKHLENHESFVVFGTFILMGIPASVLSASRTTYMKMNY